MAIRSHGGFSLFIIQNCVKEGELNFKETAT
jgi:hypothetical protein